MNIQQGPKSQGQAKARWVLALMFALAYAILPGCASTNDGTSQNSSKQLTDSVTTQRKLYQANPTTQSLRSLGR